MPAGLSTVWRLKKTWLPKQADSRMNSRRGIGTAAFPVRLPQPLIRVLGMLPDRINE